MNFDLEERTAKFGESIIKFCRELEKDEITKPIFNQLVKCGTSIGANYCKQTMQKVKETLSTKSEFAKKNPENRNIFLGCQLLLPRPLKIKPGNYGQRQKS